MSYKVFVWTEDKLHDINFDFEALQKVFADCNASIDEFTMLKFNNESVSAMLSQKENMLLFFKNQKIDQIIIDNISKLSNDKQILFDEVVLFKVDGRKIIFLPYDSDWQDILRKINLNDSVGNKNCQFKLFGIAKGKVIEGLKGLEGQIKDLQYSVLGNDLLVEVYISYSGESNLIDDVQVKIANLFKNYIYSENSLDLAECLCQMLRLKDLKLSICEGVTGGAILREIFFKNPMAKDVIKEGRVVFLDKPLTPDNVYEHTISMLSGNAPKIFNASGFNTSALRHGNVIFVDVQGQQSGDMLTCIYTIGNSKSIDVYKNTFKATGQRALNFASSAVMFNIIKNLRQNNLEF